MHDLETLLGSIADSGLALPDDVWEARKLTPFAVEARYPSAAREVTEEQYAEAVRSAEVVVCWAEQIALNA